jgi:hypothetical protein
MSDRPPIRVPPEGPLLALYVGAAWAAFAVLALGGLDHRIAVSADPATWTWGTACTFSSVPVALLTLLLAGLTRRLVDAGPDGVHVYTAPLAYVDRFLPREEIRFLAIEHVPGGQDRYGRERPPTYGVQAETADGPWDICGGYGTTLEAKRVADELRHRLGIPGPG